MLLPLTLFLRSAEALQGGERQGVAALQAVPVSTHRHPLLAQGQGAETQGEPTDAQDAPMTSTSSCDSDCILLCLM